MSSRAWLVLAAATPLILSGCGGLGFGSAVPVSYTVVEVTVAGSPYVSPAGMSSNGRVVGVYRINASSADTAFVWTVAGGLVDLGTLGGPTSEALSVNSVGDVVGQSSNGTSDRGFVFTGGSMTDTGGLAAGNNSRASAIGDEGTIAGSAVNTFGEEVPVVFDPSGFVIVLARLGGSDGRVTAVSDSGVMVGWSETAGGQTRAARWTQGVVVDLGSLANSDSVARAVNSIGQVAGESVDGVGQTRAFLFHIGQMKALALPVGATGNSAYGLSDSGVVVGSAVLGGTETAYAWYPGNQVVDLNALSVLPAGFTLTRAVGIDDDARIVAIGFNAGTGETRGFLLTPVF
ncbi:MAG: hypothetical protein IH944_08045 [Armatimonadetes bacterium]|nr:hypothetical protein [Armatimonadota bacterium]